MRADLPLERRGCGLEVGEKRDAAFEGRKLGCADGTEACVVQGAVDCVRAFRVLPGTDWGGESSDLEGKVQERAETYAVHAYSRSPVSSACASKVPMQPRKRRREPRTDSVFQVTKSG